MEYYNMLLPLAIILIVSKLLARHVPSSICRPWSVCL